MLTVGAGFAIFFAILVTMYSQSAKTDRHARYVGIMNIASEKIARTVRGMEMSAMNVFDEVGKHLDSPEAVIAALESKTSLNPEHLSPNISHGRERGSSHTWCMSIPARSRSAWWAQPVITTISQTGMSVQSSRARVSGRTPIITTTVQTSADTTRRLSSRCTTLRSAWPAYAERI